MNLTNLDNWDQLKKLPRIDFDSGKFEAGGKTYYLETKLTISRFCEFQILQRELAMGMTLQEIYKGFKDAKEFVNQMRLADVAVFLDKIVTHCSKLKEKEPTIFKICTLFINTEDEDRTTWNNDVVVKKLADWKESGIPSDDFFVVALTLVPGYIEIYNGLIQSISDNLKLVDLVVNATGQA